MGRHLLERERQLAPPLTRAHHAQHNSGHHATRRAERLSKPFPLVQPAARVRERLAQGPARERLARGHGSLERHARRDECRDALEDDREVAPARGATGPVDGFRGRDVQGEQTAVRDHGARLAG